MQVSAPMSTCCLFACALSSLVSLRKLNGGSAMRQPASRTRWRAGCFLQSSSKKTLTGRVLRDLGCVLPVLFGPAVPALVFRGLGCGFSPFRFFCVPFCFFQNIVLSCFHETRSERGHSKCTLFLACFSKQDVKMAQQPKNTTELIALMFAETKQT